MSEQAEENKMNASNLGIIFGPTLIKPRQLEAEVSLSSVVDYPHQARMVELLIRHHQMIFDVPLNPVSPTSPTAPQPALSRHSRSLLDIKEVSWAREWKLYLLFEGGDIFKQLFLICLICLSFIQSAKLFKRHSSVITSAQLMEEVKELQTRDDKAQTPG